MRVILIRHSEAAPAGPGCRDSHRHLTEAGRELARRLGERLAEEGVQLDALLTSPLARAVQTAELVGAALGFAGLIEVMPALGVDGHPRAVAADLPTRGISVAAVGHMPSISDLGSLITQVARFPGFRPAQATLVDHGRPAWTLVPPDLRLERHVAG